MKMTMLKIERRFNLLLGQTAVSFNYNVIFYKY